MMMCLKANGVDTNEDEVNRVMGAKPMQGASWEDAIACAQHFGMRIHLICPATLKQVKEFTDQGTPVMIAWNPEGRDWSHASVVFNVTEDMTVSVADPNIPDPDETTRIVSKDEFYHKWFEKWPNYLVRRPAMAVEREVTPEGRQMVASIDRQALQGKKFYQDLMRPLNRNRFEELLAEILNDPAKGSIEGLGYYINRRANDILMGFDTQNLPDKKMIKRLNELGARIDTNLLERAREHIDTPAFDSRDIPEDVRMFFGLPPFDTGSNQVYGDGYFFQGLKSKYGVRDAGQLARMFRFDAGKADRHMKDVVWRSASSGLGCRFRKANDGKWYMSLEQYDSRDEYDHYGPFDSFEKAEKFLDDEFPNPGGYSVDESGRRPPPQNPINPRGPRRWASAASRVADRALSQPLMTRRDYGSPEGEEVQKTAAVTIQDALTFLTNMRQALVKFNPHEDDQWDIKLEGTRHKLGDTVEGLVKMGLLPRSTIALFNRGIRGIVQLQGSDKELADTLALVDAILKAAQKAARTQKTAAGSWEVTVNSRRVQWPESVYKDIFGRGNTSAVVEADSEEDAIRTFCKPKNLNPHYFAARPAGTKGQWNFKHAGYEGNPDGEDIYPNKVDHGYSQPLSGGWDIMKRLQDRLLHEQGSPMREPNPRLASKVASRWLATRKNGGSR